MRPKGTTGFEGRQLLPSCSACRRRGRWGSLGTQHGAAPAALEASAGGDPRGGGSPRDPPPPLPCSQLQAGDRGWLLEATPPSPAVSSLFDVEAGDRAGDDQALDLGGALEDGVDLRVAVHALDRELARVAVAREDLDRALCH